MADSARPYSVFVALCGAALLTAGAPHAGAQSDDALVLEEIVVTARKRAENLQEIPVAVTAFDAAALRTLQLRSPTDIAAFTPGFSFYSAFGRDLDRPVIRGMSNILGEANASFFIDGVYVPGSVVSTELQNLERIEVIKGPQAALYGRATFSGAINYVSKRPTNEREGSITLTGAEHSELTAMASFSGPLVEDSLYYFVSASHYEYGGEYSNQVDNSAVGAEDTNAVTARLLYAPNDDFEGSLRVTWQRDDDSPPAVWLQGADLNNCFANDPTRSASRGYFCGEVLTRDQVVMRTDFLEDAGIERDVLRTALTLDWTLGDGYLLHSVTGYQDEELDRVADVSYAAYDPLLYLYAFAFIPDVRGSFWRIQNEQTDTFSQELRLSSPADRAFRWSIGAYYYDSDFEMPVNDRINPLVDTVAELDPSLGVQQPNASPEIRGTQNSAVFGSLEFDLSAALRATLELRYAEDEISADFLPLGGDPGPVTAFEETFDSFTPRVTLTWLVDDDLTVYGNVAKGNKPGGFNDPGADVVFYDEEESLNYEVGVKSTLAGGRALWNTSVFFIDWEDQQLTLNAQRPDGTLTSFIENIGKTEVTGLETELTWLLADNWNATLTYAYIDSEITEYINDQQALFFGCVPPPTGATPEQVATFLACVDQFGSVAGNSSPRSSEHQASLATMATFPLAGGNEWFIGGNVTYESSRFAQVHNLAETGAATRVGLQTGLRGESWDFTVWAKNLFDDDTAVDILRYIDTQAYNAAPFIPCPPVPGVFRAGENCGPNFFRIRDANGNTVVPRGFGVTLPRGRQVGATLSVRF